MNVTKESKTAIFSGITIGLSVLLIGAMLTGGVKLWGDSYANDAVHDEQIDAIRVNVQAELLEAAKNRAEMESRHQKDMANLAKALADTEIRYRQDLSEIRAMLIDIQKALRK